MNVNPARAMQVSWIDAAQLNALANTLRPHPAANHKQDKADSVSEITFSPALEPLDSEPEIHASEAIELQPEVEPQPLDEIRSKLKSIRERALQAGLIRTSLKAVEAPLTDAVEEASLPTDPEEQPAILVPEAPVILTPMPAVSGDVNQRISLFADWAQPALGSCDLFIVDDQGHLLWGPPLRSSIVLSAIMAREAISRMSAKTACDPDTPSRQTLASGNHLTLLPCATRLGIMHIAILGSEPLAEIHLPTLCHTLIQAMDI